MKTSLHWLTVLAAIILFGAGALTGLSVAPPADRTGDVVAPARASQTQTASALIDTGQAIFGYSDIKLQGNDTVWSVLDKLAEQYPDLSVSSDNYKDMGVLVKGIKGQANGAGDEYWQYWINNKYAQVAADKQAVQPGDVIMWKFTKAQFREY